MELEDVVLTLLKKTERSKSADLVLTIRKEYNLDVEKRDVDKILYYKLGNKVSQDKNYYWSLGKAKKVAEKHDYKDTPLSRLSSYYISCLSKDFEEGVWCYAHNKYGDDEYAQVQSLPQFSEPKESYSQNARRIIDKVRQEKNKLTLHLGYPIHLRKIVSRSAEFFVVEPLFLFSFDSNSFSGSCDPSLVDDLPKVNSEAIKKITGLEKEELFDEIMLLNDELGFNNPLEEQPNFEEIVMRLQKIRPKWRWVESIVPDNLTIKKLSEPSEEGVYNAAALFYSERLKYTQGLEKELEEFKELSEEKYGSTALGQLISGSFTNTHKSKAVAQREQIKPYCTVLNVKISDSELEESSVEEYLRIINQFRENMKSAKEVINYFNSLKVLQKQKTLFDLAYAAKIIENEIADNSQELWEDWLRLLPSRLTREDRKLLGDYAALLSLIVSSNQNNSTLDRKIYAKYYELQSKAVNLLSSWAVTSLSVKNKVPFQPGFFDLVIIDEASQCDIASALPLLYRAKRTVIIGDNKQLTHISSINHEQDMRLLERYDLQEHFLNWSYVGNSLFGLAQTVCSSEDIVVLKDHHRSHADIINFSNREFYGGDLRIATKYEKLKPISKDSAIRWVNVLGNVETPTSGGSINQTEAVAVVNELKRLIEMGYEGTIGVVSPFRAQADRINDIVTRDTELSGKLITRDFLVNTVHQFQGDERDIMIFSPVISKGMSKGSHHFLSRTGNLFNVAITRARSALIVVGNRNECSSCGIKYMERFVEYLSEIENRSEPKKEVDIDLGPSYPKIPSVYVSDWEKELYENLYRNNIKTVPQYQVEQYLLDLALFHNGRKLDIEIDGEKYHRNWDGDLCKRDQLRNKRLLELGWDVMRFWVYEVRDDSSGCLARIQKWMEK